MIQRDYRPGDPSREPGHRQLINVVIRPSGKTECAAYNRNERSFYLWLGGGWLDAGSEPIATWSQRPKKPKGGMSADEIEERQRLPWWLRETAKERRARAWSDPKEWAACWVTGACRRCGGDCPRKERKPDASATRSALEHDE